MKNHKFCCRKTCTIKPQSKKMILTMLILIGFMFFLCVNFISGAVWSDSLKNGTIAYWRFDETSGTNVEDTLNNYPLTSNSSNWTTGLINNGLAFNSTPYQAAYNEDLFTWNVTSDGFAISMWVKFDYTFNNTIATDVRLISKRWDSANWIDCYFSSANEELGCVVKGENTQYVLGLIDTGLGWIGGNWYHIVFMLDSANNNLSLWKNGSLIESEIMTTSIVNTTNEFDFGLGYGVVNPAKAGANYTIDEASIHNRSLSISEISDLYNSGNGLSYPTPHNQIDLISPLNDSSFSIDRINFTANYSIIESYNLTNATYYIYNSTGEIFNNSVIVDITGTLNSTTEQIDNFVLGDYEWNVLACYGNATFNNCSFADANYSFEVGIEFNSISYNNQTYETAKETFTASFTILAGSEISLAQLVYNGTNHTISNITVVGTILNLSRTIDISVNANDFTNETKDFFFRFTYAGDQIQETETYSQNISFINLQLCNATYPTTALNFTYYDVITNTEINSTANATNIQTTFNYWIGSGSAYKNYSYNNLTNNAASQYKFCIYPSNQTFFVDMDLNYEAEAYSPRTYYLRNASITNQTNEIALNLLTIIDSVKFFITVQEGMTPFPNAIITISKYFTGEGAYKTIGIRETDEVGKFIEYLDLDKRYKYSISRDGVSYGTIIKQASCEEAPCEITLQLEEAITDMWQGYYDTYAKNVAYTLFYNDTNKIVTYTFNDLTGLAQYFRLLVTQISSNQTGATICDESLYSTAGTLTCNMTGYGGDFRATGYIHRSPGLVVDFILFIISTIKDTLGAMGILVSLFIIITVALVGSWNPAVGVILVAFSVFMMKILGFVAFGYTTVILIFILAVILAVKMKT